MQWQFADAKGVFTIRKRSKQNNPEQKTRNGINNQDIEAGEDQDIIKRAKKMNEASGGQQAKATVHPKQYK